MALSNKTRNTGYLTSKSKANALSAFYSLPLNYEPTLLPLPNYLHDGSFTVTIEVRKCHFYNTVLLLNIVLAILGLMPLHTNSKTSWYLQNNILEF